MFSRLEFHGVVTEAYIGSDEKPTFAIAGATTEVGPVELLVKSDGFSLAGLLIGSTYTISIIEKEA